MLYIRKFLSHVQINIFFIVGILSLLLIIILFLSGIFNHNRNRSSLNVEIKPLSLEPLTSELPLDPEPTFEGTIVLRSSDALYLTNLQTMEKKLIYQLKEDEYFPELYQYQEYDGVFEYRSNIYFLIQENDSNTIYKYDAENNNTQEVVNLKIDQVFMGPNYVDGDIELSTIIDSPYYFQLQNIYNDTPHTSSFTITNIFSLKETMINPENNTLVDGIYVSKDFKQIYYQTNTWDRTILNCHIFEFETGVDLVNENVSDTGSCMYEQTTDHRYFVNREKNNLFKIYSNSPNEEKKLIELDIKYPHSLVYEFDPDLQKIYYYDREKIYSIDIKTGDYNIFDDQLMNDRIKGDMKNFKILANDLVVYRLRTHDQSGSVYGTTYIKKVGNNNIKKLDMSYTDFSNTVPINFDYSRE